MDMALVFREDTGTVFAVSDMDVLVLAEVAGGIKVAALFRVGAGVRIRRI